MLPAAFPEPIVFESNVDCVRTVLKNQVELTALETEFVSKEDLKKDARNLKYQNLGQ